MLAGAPFFIENVKFDGPNVIKVKNCIRKFGETVHFQKVVNTGPP